MSGDFSEGCSSRDITTSNEGIASGSLLGETTGAGGATEVEGTDEFSTTVAGAGADDGGGVAAGAAVAAWEETGAEAEFIGKVDVGAEVGAGDDTGGCTAGAEAGAGVETGGGSGVGEEVDDFPARSGVSAAVFRIR